MTYFTIIGATGFIGSHLVTFLRKQGFYCLTPTRNEHLEGNLGQVIYCAGVTGDFRSRPFDTMDAHIYYLFKILRDSNYESLLYLSSTRVYQRLPFDAIAEETTTIPVNVNDPSDLYNLSKLAGESICLANNNPKVRIARLSNVYGKDFRSINFLTVILRQALVNGHVKLDIALESSKDYIFIEDVVYALQFISISGSNRLYNVACGHNVSNADIVGQLKVLTGCSVSVNAKAVQVNFPRISIERLQQEINFKPTSLLANFKLLLAGYREIINGYDNDR